MSKQRIKVVTPVIQTRDEAEGVMNALALIATNKRIIAGRMDKEILAVQEKYSGQLTKCDAVIAIEAQKLEAWANAHPEEFPKNKKSIELLAGTIGFRKDTPSLVLLNRSFTWAKVALAVTKNKWRKFARVKIEVDKNAILSRSGTLEKPTKFQRETLPVLGLKIVQAENFFVEPNLTETEEKP
jgi:phage host-nuclease inhibitor protein Gam